MHTCRCVNRNANCSKWAKEKQCEENPGYMRAVCPASCPSTANQTGWTITAAAADDKSGQGGQQVVGPVPGQYADQGEAGDGVKHARKRKKKKGQGRPGES